MSTCEHRFTPCPWRPHEKHTLTHSFTEWPLPRQIPATRLLMDPSPPPKEPSRPPANPPMQFVIVVLPARIWLPRAPTDHPPSPPSVESQHSSNPHQPRTLELASLFPNTPGAPATPSGDICPRESRPRPVSELGSRSEWLSHTRQLSTISRMGVSEETPSRCRRSPRFRWAANTPILVI